MKQYPGLNDRQGGTPPFSMGRYTDGDIVWFREHQNSPP